MGRGPFRRFYDMKILVVGHYSRDVIHDGEGRSTEREGGLFRAVATLAELAGRQGRIIPVCGVSSDEFEAVRTRFDTLPGVDTAALFPTTTPVHRVSYFPSGDGHLISCVAEMAPPIPFERLKKFLDVDGILLNMISGADLALETLDEIRMAVRGTGAKIHFDFHNLTLGIGEGGKRFRRPIPEWRRWAFMVDTVQLNEREIAGLAVEPLSEGEAAGHLLTLGGKAVCVTRGELGATLYYSEHKKVLRRDFQPPEGKESGRTEPAGDLFGAAFTAQYLKSADLFSAAEFAVRYTADALRTTA